MECAFEITVVVLIALEDRTRDLPALKPAIHAISVMEGHRIRLASPSPAARILSWSAGKYRDPIKNKTKAISRIGTTQSIASVRLVPSFGCEADRIDESADRRVDHGRLAKKIRDPAQEDERADVAEQVE